MTRQSRSTLAPDQARRRYIQHAALTLLQQIQVDARRLDREDDEDRVAVGPFARLKADDVAASADGKSRGAITNLFRSQRQFQLQAMALVLEDPSVDASVLPEPAQFERADAWIEALASAESERGPMHEMEPVVGYGLTWALWLSQVPYGVWSKRIAEPSMREFQHSAARLDVDVLRGGLAHFGLEVKPPWTSLHLAAAMQSLIEGLWLNQCLSDRHPTSEGAPAAQAARTALRMLWEGATRPAAGHTP
jgi:hypothetical protein